MTNYDVIFIGTGHANWHAAIALRQAGKKVAMIEEDTVAGTCTNFGCNAKILLDGPFDLKTQLDQYRGIGVSGDISIDWSSLMTYKRNVINPAPIQMTLVFKKMGIELIKGHGRLVNNRTVRVNEQELTADNIVIGTGQRPSKLDIPGKTYLHDSRDFLNLDEMPKRMTFIGAGIISLEFASMAIQLGTEVTIIEYAASALAGFHQPYVKKIIDRLTDQGVTFYFNEAASSVLKVDNGYQVLTEAGKKIDTDYVLDATGRIPNVENIGLETVGIEFNRKGIVVDDHLRTTIPNIYASGDVIDKKIPRLTPTAIFESNYIAGQILGSTQKIEYPVIPSIVYTLPRIAQVGITIKEAKDKSNQYRILSIPYGQQLLFQSKNEVDAQLKAIVDQNGCLVGATIYGNEAPDLINLLTLIINQKMPVEKLNQAIFAFPTTSVGIIMLLTAAVQQLNQ